MVTTAVLAADRAGAENGASRKQDGAQCGGRTVSSAGVTFCGACGCEPAQGQKADKEGRWRGTHARGNTDVVLVLRDSLVLG